MKPSPEPYYRHRLPTAIISQSVWLYHLFSLSCRMVSCSWQSVASTSPTRRYGAGARNSGRISPIVCDVDKALVATKGTRFDGVFVLRTNTDLNPIAVMLRYKQLTTVEQTFRNARHLFETRPIYH